MVNRLRGMLHRCRSERGVALLATMFAIALMTIIVVDFTSSSALGYLSAANRANEIRASFLARSAINVGLALLAQDTRQQQEQAENAAENGGGGAPPQPFDSYASVWAIPFPPMSVNGGKVQLSVVDEARKFNINRLIFTQPLTPNPAVAPTDTSGDTSGDSDGAPPLLPGQIDPVQVQKLGRLFAILGISPDILPAIVDWLDRDSIESPGGAEADYYLRLIPPYEPRNGPMPTLGDLRLVRGVDDATFAKLRNYVTVAPEMQVNINTALPEVIACMEPRLTQNPRLVNEIIQAREARPFTNMTEFLNVPGMVDLDQVKVTADFTTRSQYFTISGMGTYAGTRKLVFATFGRNGDGTATLGSWQED